MFCSQRRKLLEKGLKACGFPQVSVRPVGKDGPRGRRRAEVPGPAECPSRETPDAMASGLRGCSRSLKRGLSGPPCRHLDLECVGAGVEETKGFVLECVSCRIPDGRCQVEVHVGLGVPGEGAERL